MTRANDSNSTRFTAATLLLPAVATVFVLSRLWVLLWAPIQTSTVGLFTETGYECRYALAHHESVYAVHERKIRDELAQQQTGGPPVDPSRLRLEYPPLATWAMMWPTYFAPAVGDDWELTPEHFARAKIAFRWMMAAIDAATFVALALLLRRLYPGQFLTQAMRLLVYTIGGLALFHVLYDRFDLVAGSFMVIALALLLGRTHWSIALAALAVAIHLKLVPILLAPAFVVGCMRRPSVSALFKPALVVLAWCAAIGLPFVVSSGSDVLGFLAYHAERGVQVESVPATILMLAGKVTNLELSHGAIDVVSPWSSAAGSISTWLALLAALVISLATVRWSIRQRADDDGKIIAQSHAPAIIVLAMLMLFASLCVAKVFSPQYLLWLLPLVPLLPGRWVFQVAFLLMCVLTTYIFPYRYWSDVVRITNDGIPPPTAPGVALLVMRNGTLIALTIALAVIALRISRRSGGAIEGRVGSG